MKKTSLLLLSCLFTAFVSAQEISRYDELKVKNDKNTNIDTTATIYSGNLSLGLMQGLLHNWSAGGEIVSATFNGLFNGSYIQYMDRAIWTNNLDLAYGQLYTYSNAFIPRKIDDRIDLTSKYGYRLMPGKDWYFTTLFNAKTQFSKAYDYTAEDWKNNPISSAFSPLYLTLAPGIEYRKGSELSLFFSPAAARMTVVSKKFTNLSPEGAFGVRNGETSRFELGAYLTARYNKEITKDFSYNGRFDMYSNYLAKDVYDAGTLIRKDGPGNIDLLWDNNFSYKFYKWFSINFGVLGIYDNDAPYTRPADDNDPTAGLGWWQIKQYMNIGFNYKF